jgi:hypothetical protein
MGPPIGAARRDTPMKDITIGNMKNREGKIERNMLSSAIRILVSAIDCTFR